MKLIITVFFLFLTAISPAQTINLSSLPSYDCSLKKVMTIISNPTIMVHPDNSSGLDAILNEYSGVLGSNGQLKKEAALTASDLSKNLFIIGIVQGFKKWKVYNCPVTVTSTGFIINNKSFTGKTDGFVYTDSNRIIIGGNSLKAVKDAQLALTGGHDIVIVQNNTITFFGNRKGANFDWFNLQKLKSANYVIHLSPIFSAIYVSKTFKENIDYLKLNRELNLYAKQFLAVYHIPMPVKKTSWLLHSNIQEYGIMSGMFGLTCPGNNSAGFSIRGEIHTNGFNTALVKHEYAHFLFDNTIPQDNNPAFFVEGCVEYVTNLNDTTLYRQRLNIAKNFKDSLNYSDLIIGNKDFYGRYSSENYSICGVFVKYIIDSFGVETFKQYCLQADKQVNTKKIFKIDFEVLAQGYKDWLGKQ